MSKQYKGKKYTIEIDEKFLFAQSQGFFSSSKTKVELKNINDISLSSSSFLSGKDTLVINCDRGDPIKCQFALTADAKKASEDISAAVKKAKEKTLGEELLGAAFGFGATIVSQQRKREEKAAKAAAEAAYRQGVQKIVNSVEVTTTTVVNWKTVTTSDDYQKVAVMSKYSRSPLRDSYPSMWSSHHGIEDARSIHLALIRDGLLEQESPKQSLPSLKVAELKDITAELGIEVTGKKADLVAAIAEAATDEYLITKLPNKIYVVSTKGQAFLDEHQDYYKLINYGLAVDFEEYENRKSLRKSFFDTLWDIYNDRIRNANGDYRRIASVYWNMATLCDVEGMRDKGVELLLQSFYMDISNYDLPSLLHDYSDGSWTQKDIRDFFESNNIIVTTFIDDIAEHKDVFKPEIIDKVYTQKLPMQICDIALFRTTIKEIMNGKYDNEKLLGKLKREYNRICREYFEQHPRRG